MIAWQVLLTNRLDHAPNGMGCARPSMIGMWVRFGMRVRAHVCIPVAGEHCWHALNQLPLRVAAPEKATK